MTKLIAIDIDGTLVNSQRELTPRVIETIQKVVQKDVKIVLCTGRPLKGVLPLLQQLNLIADDQYVITYNGSLVISTNGEIIVNEYALTFDDLKIVKQLSEQFETYYHAADRNYLYTTSREIGVYMAHEADLVHMPIRVRTLDELEALHITIQKMMLTDEPEKLDAIIQQLPLSFTQNYTVVKSAPFYLEILHRQANKGNAIKALANYLHIPLEQTMGIGDNYNDMDMLNVVHTKVAMGNAVDAIKQIATHHTYSNDEDGVAHILEQVVL